MVMKLHSLTALLLAAPLAAQPGLAWADGTAKTGKSQVTIDRHADYDFVGTNLDVGLRVRCSGGSGAVSVDVEQYPPETRVVDVVAQLGH
jgi:hypothetical protein